MLKRLENLKKAKTFSWGELCNLLEISRTMLHYIKTGERELSAKALRRLAQAEKEAGIAIVGLIEPVKLTRRTVGIYGIAHCRTHKPQFYDAKQPDHLVPQVEVPPGLSRVKRLAAFRASDNSMAPIINENDIIFFSPDHELINGNVCVLKYDDTIVCKRFYKNDSIVSLSSDATGIAPIVLKPDQIDWAYRALEVISVRKL